MKIYWKVTIERPAPCPDKPKVNPYTGEYASGAGISCGVYHFTTETKEMSKDIKEVSEFDEFKKNAPSNCFDFKLEL